MDDFAAAIESAKHDMGCKGIGTMAEKSLHLTLKYYFAPDSDTHERPVGGFIADAVTEDGIIEIQTRGLNRLKPKLDAFLPVCPVTVVYPVAKTKWLCRADKNGELLSRRKSPKHETVHDAMREIYTLRDYLSHPNLRICVCALEIAEYSVQKNKSRREKLDREPILLHEIWMFESPADYAALLPREMPELFTAPDFAHAVKTTDANARMYLNLLSKMGCLVESGRKSRYKVWKKCVSDTIRG